MDSAITSFKLESDKKITSFKLESDKKITSFNLESDKKITDCIATVKNDLESKIELTLKELTTVKSELDSKIELTLKELFAQMDVDIHARAWLARVLEERVQKGLAQKSDPPASTSKEDTNYFRFEDKFRGSREDIKQRQTGISSIL